MEKRLLGKILGEIYRVQNAIEGVSCSTGEAHIYALLNGFEDAINDELNSTGCVSSDELESVSAYLAEIYNDSQKMADFKGFYDIENDLSKMGISRMKALTILKFFKADNQFLELIHKMDSEHSPAECRNFDLNEWYR